MDRHTVIIGSKSKFSNRLNQASLEHKHDWNEPVDVYVQDVFVSQMPVGLLTRFSQTASGAFPKPETNAKVDYHPKKSLETNASDSKDRAVGNAEVAKMAAAVRQMNIGGQTSSNKVVPSSEAVTKNKELHLHLQTLWHQPSIDAFKWAFTWMNEAKGFEGGKKPIDYGVPEPHAVSLSWLIDIYAAALVLGLRPVPHHLRYTIMTRFSDIAPMVADIKLVHERLPLGDSITTRAITRYFRSSAKRAYTSEQRKQIHDYVYTVDKALLDRFREIEEHRNETAVASRSAASAQRLQREAENFDTGRHDGSHTTKSRLTKMAGASGKKAVP